jgi:hypothetical protein
MGRNRETDGIDCHKEVMVDKFKRIQLKLTIKLGEEID